MFIIAVVKLVDLVVDTKSLVNGIDRIVGKDCLGSIDRVDVTAGNKEIHPFI